MCYFNKLLVNEVIRTEGVLSQRRILCCPVHRNLNDDMLRPERNVVLLIITFAVAAAILIPILSD